MSSFTDVNAEFDTQRATQIAEIASYNASAADRQQQMDDRQAVRLADWDQRVADGKLIPIGAGKFRVDDPGTWDDREVFTMQRFTGTNGQAMVLPMPDHGLAVREDGTARFYGRQPEWTRVGTIIEAGLSSVPAVLKAGGIDWEVEKVPSLYERNGELLTDERSWHNIRTDSGYSLGTVGSIYKPFQNAQAADFLHEIVADHGAVFETAGELRDGETVFVTMRMPENLVVDEGGLADPIARYIAWSNNHSGKGKAKLVTTPWRIRCGNTHAFSLRDAARSIGFSHSGDLTAKVELARKALGMSEKYFEVLQAEETTLARTPMSNDEFDDMLLEIWPEKDDMSKREAGIFDRREDALFGAFESYSAELGQTAYAAENAFTWWWDHTAPRRALNGSMAAARVTAVFEDDDLARKTTVHRSLLTLANR